MYSHYIPHLKFHLKLASYLYCTPCIYDEKNGTFFVKKDQFTRLANRAFHVILALYFVFQFLQLFGDHTLPEKLQSILFCMVFVCTIVVVWDWDLNAANVALINGMVSYEKRSNSKIKRSLGTSGDKSTIAKLLIAFMKTAPVTSVIFPILMATTVYNSPCMPPFLGSYIVPKLYGHCAPPITMKLILAAFEWIVYNKLICIATINVEWSLLAGAVYILDHLNAISVKPNKSGWIMEYRGLQVLNGVINSELRHITTTILLGIAIIQMFAGFVCFKFREDVEWPSFALFPILFVETFIANIVCSSSGGKMFGNSNQLIQQRRREVVKGKGFRKLIKYRLMQLKACPELRVQFGRNNFIEETTPLVIQRFCLDNFVTLLVLHR